MMPRIFVHFAFFFLIITAITGVWMRAVPLMQQSWLIYDNVLHAHSHIAILGWAFFGLFIILLTIIWPHLKQKKHGIILAITIFIVSFMMFIAFLHEGYDTYSIIMSTVHIFVEYWVAYFIYKQLQVQHIIPNVAKLFIKGSLIALIISSFGPFALGYFGATGLRDSPFFDMSIYFFLHFQYNGWLFLFLIGIFLTILHHTNIIVSLTFSKYGFWIYFISLFPWYTSAILWAGVGNVIKIVATIGSLGQWIGVVTIILSFKNVWPSMKYTFTNLTRINLISTFLLLITKSVMELGLISPMLANLVFDTRSVIIGYLHLTLLGFVSLFILTQFLMVHLIDANRDIVFVGFVIFFIGFILNEGFLFLMGLSTWLETSFVPFATEVLFIASILLLIGISLIWRSLSRKKAY